MKRDSLLVLLIGGGLIAAGFVARAQDNESHNRSSETSEERLYLNPSVMKRVTLAFNGVGADWYWLRSLQYVGRKVVAYEDSHEGRMDFATLASLDLRLLPSLLKMSATLDPQFMEPYSYGAVVLPEINSQEAISLINWGIAANPQQWRLHQHLGYIYWQRGEYSKASEVYDAGSNIPGAPAWMAVMSGRMKAEGGSRDAAREMYQHLYEASNDDAVKQMVAAQIMRLDSLDEQETIRRVLNIWTARSGRCPSSWKEIAPLLRAAQVRLEAKAEAPIDPSGVPYQLLRNGCDVDVDVHSRVPKR